jgi:hypothetical protein
MHCKQAHRCNGYVLELCLEGMQFESWPGYQIKYKKIAKNSQTAEKKRKRLASYMYMFEGSSDRSIREN